MKTPTSLILVIDDNGPILAKLSRLLEAAHYRVRLFRSLEETRKLLSATDIPSCAIVGLDLPGGSGLAVQSFLNQAHPGMPVIFISRHPDVASSIQVMKAGALDLLVAPFDEQALLRLIRHAVLQERHSQEERHELDCIRDRLNSLTPREREVLEYLLRGLINKQTAAGLGTCEKTIKVHRGRIMKKMRVQSIAELVQMVMRVRGASAFQSVALHPSADHPRTRRRDGPLVN